MNTEQALIEKETHKKHTFTRVFLIASSILLAYSVAVFAAGILSADFAEVYSEGISSYIRRFLALLTFAFPFSITEALVFILPLAAAVLLISALVMHFKYKKKAVSLYFVNLFTVILLLASLFINSFGICYKRYDLADKMELDVRDISSEDVFRTAAIMSALAERVSPSVIYNSDGSSHMPYDFRTMHEKIKAGYEKTLYNVPHVFSVKPVALSEPWTYTHISGMYMPLTGESNVNVNYPDFVITFSTAHEMAHQMGYASEDEANFLAFLACLNSGDDYLVYSAALNAVDYLFSDLGGIASGFIMDNLDVCSRGELGAYSAFFAKYRNSKASVVTSEINDSYLKSLGVTDGVQNYSKVSELIVAYMIKKYPHLYQK